MPCVSANCFALSRLLAATATICMYVLYVSVQSTPGLDLPVHVGWLYQYSTLRPHTESKHMTKFFAVVTDDIHSKPDSWCCKCLGLFGSWIDPQNSRKLDGEVTLVSHFQVICMNSTDIAVISTQIVKFTFHISRDVSLLKNHEDRS